MKPKFQNPSPDFKGIGYSKIGYFKETRSKIKELERLNIELAQRHNKLEAFFNSIGDGLTILDRNHNIVFVNQIQKAMFPGSALTGEKCYHAYYRKDKACKDCPAIRTISQQTNLRGEIFVKSGEHSGRFYEWTTSPIRDARGQVCEVILLMRDVTERKEYEYKLMQADRMAAVGFLAAGIAHEINNPLTSIAGFSEGLLKRLKKLEDELPPQQLGSFREYLQIISTEAYRCKDIISNLQDFSRNSSDAFEILSIDKLLRATVSLCRQRAKDLHITISYSSHLTRGLDTIRGKETQLKHLFLNLLIRAFKSVEQGGELHILSSNESNQIKIVITENPTGVPSDGQEFDASGHRSSLSSEGRAVDLSICYNIVQHHKGTIAFEKNKELGDVLTVYFPASI
jgi:two-component system, NtrC family, sensor kinase